MRKHVTAPDALRAWMALTGSSQADLAERLGVHQTTVSAWLRNAWKIQGAHAFALERLTGIKAETWFSEHPPKRARARVMRQS
jgi:plasmid maintenance system antidote protein VapI